MSGFHQPINRFFSGNTDADRLILMEVEDQELFSICVPTVKEDIYSKYAQKLCNEDFWRNRLSKRFPLFLKDKPENLSWKKYYASLVYYISQMNDPEFMKSLRLTFTFDALKYPGKPRNQYRFFLNNRGHKNLLLREAAKQGELGIVKFFLDRQADIHFSNDFALRYASANGHLAVVKYLVEHGADIHAMDDLPVENAILYGDLEVVKYLIERGAIIPYNSIKLAENKGHYDMVDYLKSII